jgi:hypothetical protein
MEMKPVDADVEITAKNKRNHWSREDPIVQEDAYEIHKYVSSG